MPTVADRIAQEVAKRHLEPLLEPVFHEDSNIRPSILTRSAVPLSITATAGEWLTGTKSMLLRTVFKTPWFSIDEIDGREPGTDGSGKPYYCLSRGDGVICLVLTVTGDVLLVRQYRPPLGRHTLEMPAGGVEPGETPAQAIVREVAEEAGYVCGHLIEVGGCRIMPNRESAREYFFIGLDARRLEEFTPAERIELKLLTRPAFRELIGGGGFEQTVALGGLFLAEQKFSFRFFDDSLDTISERLCAPRKV